MCNSKKFKFKCCCFGNINKIDKPLVRLYIRTKERKTQITNIRNKKVYINIDLRGLKNFNEEY